MKQSVKIFLCLSLAFAGCSSSSTKSEQAVNNQPPLDKESFDSIVEKNNYVPERKNVVATTGSEQWISNAYTVNVYTQNDKKIYSIYLTNGKSQITINYSGPEKAGVVNTGDMLQAAYRESDQAIFPCQNGLIEFTTFDMENKKMSGRFKLYCTMLKDGSKKNFDEAVFTELSWN